ncbi:oocyte zinc finger protein XlCOF26-like [Condylostylus longicornis]|uniref:oocyte zinc finger protein XlCOF26-like n=1 Tax=Condylostylus longicornis TaxID=2530218 RepID=UPI00244E42C2|nr:oocyte zinc finger protein XlCOF26-like [Condylostylus longicornis]
MEFAEDFLNILYLLKLEQLVKRRNLIRSALKSELIRKSESLENIESSEIERNNKRKAIFKKSDLLPSNTQSYINQSIANNGNVKFIQPNSRNKSEMCDLCGVIIRRSNMEFHMNTHFNRKPFICDFKNCKQSFSAPSTLFRHRKLHTNIKKFSCDICFAKFHFNGNLQKHKITHLEPKFECTICGHMFKSSIRLRYHTNTHKESENICCTIPSCNRKFKNSYSVREHLRRFHNIRVKERVTRANIGQEKP